MTIHTLRGSYENIFESMTAKTEKLWIDGWMNCWMDVYMGEISTKH